MKKILFICHGNICRSPMAEMVLGHLLLRHGMTDVVCASAATSTEEIGHDIYPPVRAELARHGVPAPRRRARQVTRQDYCEYDLLVCMDNANVRNLRCMLGGDPDGKIHRLMDFTSRPGEVDDPWYSRRFDLCYRDVLEGCEALLAYLTR